VLPCVEDRTLIITPRASKHGRAWYPQFVHTLKFLGN